MKQNLPMEFWLFYHDPDFARDALNAGITGMIIDWENRGKTIRQEGFDTQINFHTEDDLMRLRKFCDRPIICRINEVHDRTADEIERGIGGGAAEILVPMVRTARDVEFVLTRVRERCGVGILIETCDALEALDELADLPLSRYYVGLNDLWIDRRRLGLSGSKLFTPIADGTLDRVRRHVPGRLGFGGLTLPDRGKPIPCRLLMSEMVRLDCAFAFLRRSFVSDVCRTELPEAVESIRATLDDLAHGSETRLEANRLEIGALINGLSHVTTTP